MKRNLNKILIIALALFSHGLYAQSVDCSTAVQICDGIFPEPAATAAIGTSELNSTNDGCLGGENGSNWYWFEVTTTGTIAFSAQGVTESGASADIDGAVWGPFTSLASGCTAISGGNDPLRCSYAAAPHGIELSTSSTQTSETSTGDGIVGAISGSSGEFYIMFLDNYNAGNSSAAVSVSLDFTSGNTAIFACPAPATPCAPTCAAATASECPKQDDGDLDSASDPLPAGAFGTCQDYEPPFVAGDMFTQCYTLNSGVTGTIGAVQQISTRGTDADDNGSPDCSAGALASRTYTLVDACGNAAIPASNPLGGYSSTFNPEWDQLTVSTDYILCIETTIPDVSGITCNYRASCLDFYHPPRGGCELTAAGTDIEYCFGTTPGAINADMGFAVTSFYAGPNATANSGVAFVEICGDYDASANTTAGDPTTNPNYTEAMVGQAFTYGAGAANGTDTDSGMSCDYITLVPVTYINIDADNKFILDGDVSNICVGTPLRIDFRPQITATVGVYDCDTEEVTISPAGGSQEDGIGTTQADGTATVAGSYTVELNGESQTLAAGATGTFTSLADPAANGSYTATITDSDGCTQTVTISKSCVVSGCSSYAPPTVGTQACADQQFNIALDVLDCPGFVSLQLDYNLGSFASELNWELVALQSNTVVASGNGATTVSDAGFIVGPLDLTVHGVSYFFNIYDNVAGDGWHGSPFFTITDLGTSGTVYSLSGSSAWNDASTGGGFTASVQNANPVTVAWSVDGVVVETVNYGACADINYNYVLTTTNVCSPEETTVGYSITCPAAGGGVVAQDLAIPVTIYPAPPTAANQLVSIAVDQLTCMPSITYLGDCSADEVMVTETTAPTSGSSGNAVYNVEYTGDTSGPDCCATGGPATAYVYDGTSNPALPAFTPGDSPFFPGGTPESALAVFGPFTDALGTVTAFSITIDISNHDYVYTGADACGGSGSYWVTLQVDNGGAVTTVYDENSAEGTNQSITLTNADVTAVGTSITESSILGVYVYSNCSAGTYNGSGDDSWSADISISSISSTYPNLIPTAADCEFDGADALTVPYSCPLCPTSSEPDTPADICSGDSPSLATAETAVNGGITDADNTQLGSIAWFMDEGLTMAYGGTITHSGLDNCVAEDIVLYAGIQCDKNSDTTADDLDDDATTDPDYIAAGTATFTTYPTPVVGPDFLTPTAPCVTTISSTCTTLTIGYSLVDGGPYNAAAPTINAGDADLTVYYEVYVTGAPSGCSRATGNYVVTCPTCPSSTEPTPTASVCSGTTPTLPDAMITAAVTDPSSAQLGGVSWFTDAALTTAYVAAATSNTTCAATTLILYAGIQCDTDGDNVADNIDADEATDPDYISAGTFTVTIYPEPTAVTHFTAPTGCATAVTISGSCGDVGVMYDNDGDGTYSDASPTAAADGVTVNYEVMVTGAPASCSTTGSYTITNGTCACTNSPSVMITETNVDVCDDGVATFNYTVANGPATITTSNGTIGNFSTTSLANGTSTFTYTPAAGEIGSTINFTATIADPDTGGPCMMASDAATVTSVASPTANAGADPAASTECSQPITLAATGTGMWSDGGAGGAFSDATSPTSTYTPDASDAGNTVTLTWTVTGTSPCSNATDNVDVTVGACSTRSISITDPCMCQDNSTTLTNGTFEEVVTISGLVAGDMITVVSVTGLYSDVTAATAYTTATAEAAINVTTPTATLTGYHIDATGYTLVVDVRDSNGDLVADDLTVTNTCAYPTPQVDMPTDGSSYCPTDATAITLGGSATEGDVAGSGTFEISIDAGAFATATTITPSDHADGTTIVIRYNYTGGDDTTEPDDGGTVANPIYPGCMQSIDATITISNAACNCNANAGTFPGN